MRKSLDGIDDSWIPLISDKAKGLLPTVEEVFPGKIHAYCLVHLRGNVKVKFGLTDFLAKLTAATSSGTDAANYIRSIDPKLWARFAFPLPRLGKVSSNPCEQANSGLLPIRQYALFKLLVQMWFYIQGKHRDRKIAYMQSDEQFSDVARRRLEKNRSTYGQWQVLDDGEGSAKVQTQDMQEEYLVTLNPTPTCSCWELQEMCWPCQHVMAWDNHQGRDYTRHFHICWKIESLQAMYQGRLPPFLSEDLEMSLRCMPPPIANKKGRRCIVRIPSGGGSVQNQQVGEDEFVDADGHLYRWYPIEDNSSLQDPMPRPTPNTAEFVPEELGGEHYSSGEEDDVGDDSLRLREIIGGKFGTTQEPQKPEWQAYNLTNWEGLSQVQDHLEGRWRPRSPESVSDFASTDWEF
ncbi:unnamed protein product [Calypogeia fissa]